MNPYLWPEATSPLLSGVVYGYIQKEWQRRNGEVPCPSPGLALTEQAQASMHLLYAALGRPCPGCKAVV